MIRSHSLLASLAALMAFMSAHGQESAAKPDDAALVRLAARQHDRQAKERTDDYGERSHAGFSRGGAAGACGFRASRSRVKCQEIRSAASSTRNQARHR